MNSSYQTTGRHCCEMVHVYFGGIRCKFLLKLSVNMWSNGKKQLSIIIRQYFYWTVIQITISTFHLKNSTLEVGGGQWREKKVSNLPATLSKTTTVLKKFHFYCYISHHIGLKPDFINYLERMGVLVNRKIYVLPVYIPSIGENTQLQNMS